MIDSDGDALAAARLADDPERLARRWIEKLTPSTARTTPSMTWKYVRRSRTSSSGRRRLARRPARDDGRAVTPCDRGSSASRRPSPMKLIAITVRAMAMPGKNAHHQLPDDLVLLRVRQRVAPAEVLGVETEVEEAHERLGHDRGRPRAGSPTTMIGPRALGRMWRKVIRLSLTPTARAASTKSCFAERQEQGTDEPGEARPEQQPEDERSATIRSPAAEEPGGDEDDEQERDRQHQVDEAHQERRRPARRRTRRSTRRRPRR